MRALIRNLPFKLRIFLGCFTVALIPLLFSGILMVRIFDSSLKRQSSLEITRQIQESRDWLDEILSSCETACEALMKEASVYRVLIDNSTIDFQQDLYLLLYQAVQETYSYASFSIYDAGGMLRFSTDNSKAQTEVLPVHWGLLRKASLAKGLVYYRADPHLVTNPEILFQAACSLESTERELVFCDFLGNRNR